MCDKVGRAGDSEGGKCAVWRAAHSVRHTKTTRVRHFVCHRSKKVRFVLSITGVFEALECVNEVSISTSLSVSTRLYNETVTQWPLRQEPKVDSH